MTEPVPECGQYSAERYFELAECGIIAPDDHVELLEGLIVAMAPQSPPHCATITRVQQALQGKLGLDVVVRVQMSFLAGPRSVPEPDIAVVPGRAEDYFDKHPSRAHLIVEVAQSSVIQDRITKAAIYARAGIPCYWIVNVRDRCVEVFRGPDRWKAEYASVVSATGTQLLTIDAYPEVTFEAAELLPPAPVDEES
jgi:Uma2 family endonuclease